MEKKIETHIPAGQNQKKFTTENERLYTSNEVAKICKIGRTTLLRMEECGYDKARYIDSKNGYRYYDLINIHKIMMYEMLQKMGLSVTEISAYYRHELEPEAFLEELHERLAIAQRCVDEFEARFGERESKEFSYIALPDVTCYCFPCDIRSPKDQIEYNYKKLQEIYNAGYEPFPTTPMFSITPDFETIYDEESYRSDHSMICSAIYPNENLPMENVVHFKSKTAFSLLYHGNSDEIMSTGGKLLLDEMKKRKLTPAGPLYGICILGPFFGTDIDPQDYVFRWAIPI
ncbi:MAG: MerR family transcriptional regulator [Lachnospiraceae bacterium]|nr:MerR family transcriptional regulator [Lachnospiraceae bacterium]